MKAKFKPFPFYILLISLLTASFILPLQFSPEVKAQTNLKTVEKTFGNFRIGANYINTWKDIKYACRFYLPENGNVTKISVCFGFVYRNVQYLRAFIYNDNNGTPSSLVAASNEVPLAVESQTSKYWYDFPFPSPLPLNAGYYWLGFFYSSPDYVGSGMGKLYYDAGETNQTAQNSDAYGDGPSNPFGTPTYSNYKYSIYATYLATEELPTLTGKVVQTVNTSLAIRWQEKMFYAKGRTWITYTLRNGTYPIGEPAHFAYITSSADGVTWTTPQLLRSMLREYCGENLQVIFDGTYAHFFVRLAPNHAIYYRRGMPNSDGSISWSTDWQIAWYPNWTIGQGSVDFYAALDSNGYPWICWGYNIPYKTDINYIATYVTKSDWNNGSWHTAAGFPMQVSSYPMTNNIIVPLLNGEVYLMYFTAPGKIYGKLWNGTAWSSEEVCTSSNIVQTYAPGYESWSRSVFVDSQGNIHLVFLTDDYRIVYVKRTYGVGWGEETVVEQLIQRASMKIASPSLGFINNTLIVFWVGFPSPNIIYYKKCSNGTWDSSPTPFIEELTDKIPSVDEAGADGKINPFPKAVNNGLGLMWITNSTVPNMYKIKFAVFTLPLPPPPPPPPPKFLTFLPTLGAAFTVWFIALFFIVLKNPSMENIKEIAALATAAAVVLLMFASLASIFS